MHQLSPGQHQFLLKLSLVNNWHARQIDFVLAYPQAKVSNDVYMLPPEKFKRGATKLARYSQQPNQVVVFLWSKRLPVYTNVLDLRGNFYELHNRYSYILYD